MLENQIHYNYQNQLKIAIQEHLELFKEVLVPAGHHLAFKPHQLVHYPRFVESYGPLVDVWCFRLEGKHLPFKRCANVSNNCQNLPKTFAIKNQYQFAEFLCRDSYKDEPLEYSVKESKNIKEIEAKFGLNLTVFPQILQKITSFKYFGYLFAVEDFLSLPDDNFIVIKEIFMHENNLFLIIQEIETLYVDYLDAFQIVKDNFSYSYINWNELKLTLSFVKPIQQTKIAGNSYINRI